MARFIAKDYLTEVDNEGHLRVFTGGRWRLGEMKECWYCGKKFPTQLRKNNNRVGKYCSLDCWNKTKNKAYHSQHRVTHFCVICGDKFLVQKSKAKRIKTCRSAYCTAELKRRIGLERHKVGGFAPKS